MPSSEAHSLLSYITQHDNSPLMNALVVWREGALRTKSGSGLLSSRPVSPEAAERLRRPSSGDFDAAEFKPPSDQKAEELPPPLPVAKKPSSSSWVRWWSRSRRDTDASRPELRPANSEPSVSTTLLVCSRMLMAHCREQYKRKTLKNLHRSHVWCLRIQRDGQDQLILFSS